MGGQPVTFHVGPGAEAPGNPKSWGDCKVGISWRQGVGGREDTELLSNTWGAEGGGQIWRRGTGRTMGVQAYGLCPHREGWPGLALGSQPHALASHHGHWPLATLPSSLSPPPEALEVQGLQPVREEG